MKQYTNIEQYGNTILYRGIEDGVPFLGRIRDYKPTLYIPTKKPSKYKTIHGKPVEPINPGSIKDCSNFIEQYAGVSQFEIFGNERYIYQFISDEYPDEIDWDQKSIRVVKIDIETASENGFPNVETVSEEVLLITIKYNDDYFVFGVNPYKPTSPNVHYHECLSEEDLLRTFLEKWKEISPDIVTGWNINFFDIPYLVNRMVKVLSENVTKEMSPWNIIQQRNVTLNKKEIPTYYIYGVCILDYLDLYKKFTYVNRESYKLDHIAEVELGTKKLDYSEYDSLKDLYKSDWKKFTDYNIRDVEIIDQLEDKMKLLELCINMAYDAKVNFDDVFSQVRTWDTIIYNHLKKQNIVIPIQTDKSVSESIVGAYVKEPLIGWSKWVVSLDLDALYPHLMILCNISPETLLNQRDNFKFENLLSGKEDLSGYKENEICVAANGSLYDRKKQGFLPFLMEKMYNDRAMFKKKMLEVKKKIQETGKTPELEKLVSRYNNQQMARKIQLNSAYGALANKYFRYYDNRMAEAITLTGQLAIQWIERHLNEYLNDVLKTKNHDFVITSDTDSVYICLEKIIDKIFKNQSDKSKVVDLIDKIVETKIKPFIDEKYKELSEYINAYKPALRMKRETIADVGVFCAKKRYLLNAYDIEGVRYKTPEVKVTGIEVQRSSTPAICRKHLKESIRIILNSNKEELMKYIDKCKTEFKNSEPEEIAFPRGCNGMSDYSCKNSIYKKATPIAVRGGLLYNHHIKKNGLDKKYPLINEGEKIKYLYLVVPNPIHENIISFPSSLPQELNLHAYIDYETQFEKAFMDPLKGILKVINWNIEETSSLESLFA